MPQVAGAPAAASDLAHDVVVRYRGKQVRFAPFGGTLEAKLRSNQFYEAEMLQYIEALELPGTYVDVGGYVGTHSLFFATYCPVDLVHTFEPRARCHLHLQRNVEANQLQDRVRTYRKGLSDRNETFALTLEGGNEEISCHPLDELVDTPVAVMKIDVEGMEAKVLAGAARILRTHKPLIFVEAHHADELARNLAVLAPFGYRATGRVFNSSPTYELAADDSPIAGTDRMPRVRPLLDPSYWKAEAGLALAWTGETSKHLVVTSGLAEGGKAHVTQGATSATRAASCDLVALSSTSRYALQADGRCSDGLAASVLIIEHDEAGAETAITRYRFHPRLFATIAFKPATRRVRVALRLIGPGVLELDALAWHVIEGRSDLAAAEVTSVLAAAIPEMPGMPGVDGAPTAAADGADDVVVRHRDRAVRFARFGGRIEARLRTNRFYEAEMLEYIEALGLRGTYVDVGGYVGTHALFLATYCPADMVHSFEPRARCHLHLQRNVEANHLQGRVRAHRLGLSDRDESFPLTLDGATQQIECHPLDQLVDTPVVVMKIDVEGMEPKVLAGALRILRTHKPLVFVEAHSAEELQRDLAVLAPLGYRPTGRVFNASPTYELAAADSPTAGADRLPEIHSLTNHAHWVPDDSALTVTTIRGLNACLRFSSSLLPDGAGHVTQPTPRLQHPPTTDLVTVSPSSRYFLHFDGVVSPGMSVAVFVMEYDDRERIAVSRHHLQTRHFIGLELAPATRRLRIALRLTGPGTVDVNALAIHVLAQRSAAAGVTEAIAVHAAPGAVILDRTSATAKLAPALERLGGTVTRDPAVAAAAGELVVVVQDLPAHAAGRGARCRVFEDAALAPRVVQVLLFDDPATVAERGLLAQASRTGWAITAVHQVADPRYPYAIGLAYRGGEAATAALAIGNERRFAELLAAPRGVAAPAPVATKPPPRRPARVRLKRWWKSLRRPG